MIEVTYLIQLQVKLKKQSASVADLASKANTAFFSGSKINARIRKSEKKFHDRMIRSTLSFVNNSG